MNDFYSKKRVWFTIGVLIFITTAILIKFFVLAVTDSKKLTISSPSVERGSIVDRNGKPLAVSTNFYHFGVSPDTLFKSNTNPESFASVVSPIIGIPQSEIVKKLDSSKSSSFIYIKKKITQDEYDQLSDLIIANHFSAFCVFDKISGRVYPENALASQLIGYMGDDGIGLSGIEYSQQNILSPNVSNSEKSTVYGDNIYLTIDAGLQFKLEKIAREALRETNAQNIMMIACDAKNGEILSYISLPSTDLNDYSHATTKEKIDYPATQAYEPGSVFKIFSTAAFYDSGAVQENDSFLCDGIYERKSNLGEKFNIKCLDHHGWLNIRTTLKYSCNDTIAQMTERIDTQSFLNYLNDFGFGEKTTVEVPSQTKGSVKKTSDKFWSARSKPTMAIGQEISVNALQMVQAATTFCNNGQRLDLTVIKKVTDKDGTIKYQHTPTYSKQVLKKETAQYILSCMETTAKSGTGSKASLSDVNIGVKTGTAQMADNEKGGYSTTDFLSNCIAIFPVENPQVILYIVIEKAQGETYAGRIVAPVIKKAADEIIDHMGIGRDNAESFEHSGKILIKENPQITMGQTVPNFIGRPKRDLIPLLTNSQNINYNFHGEGWVKRQEPKPGTPLTENMTIELYFE